MKAILAAAAAALAIGSTAGATVQTRCGWINNPTPANWWLVDGDGLWMIGVQGGHQAPGLELIDISRNDAQYVSNYRYACGCVRADYRDGQERVAARVLAYQSRTLKACLEDPNVPAPVK